MIFISYESRSSFQMADAIVEFLEGKGLKCWYAPRDVTVSYASDIVDAIGQSEVFVLLLNKSSSENKNVCIETEWAHKKRTKDKTLEFIPVKLENFEINSGNMAYYLASDQYIEAFNKGMSQILEEILTKIKKITHMEETASSSVVNAFSSFDKLGEEKNGISLGNIIGDALNYDDEESRVANRYYDVDDRIENRRLKTEGELLLPFEREIYDRLLEGRENQNVLIASCMFAPAIMNKLVDRPQISKILGLCYNDKACFSANYDYKTPNCQFITQDCEDRDLEDNLERYMDEMGIKGFDVIDITMGFLDWKNPFRVIRKLSHYANKGCKIYVRDIDDGVVFAYPDRAGYFKEFFKLYKLDPISGYRNSGRRIYGFLKKVGATNIQIEKSGIDTAHMTGRELEKMFFAWTGFIPNDFNIALKKEPNNPKYLKAREWLDEHYDDIEELFFEEDFLFNSGYFLLTAEIK